MQDAQTIDPHFRRAECVHPRDDANDIVVTVGFKNGAADRIRILQCRLPNDPHRKVPVTVQVRDDFLRLVSDLSKCVLTVEVLATGEEPDLFSFKCAFHSESLAPSLCCP